MSPVKSNSKVFQYNRGNKYSVVVEVINKGEHVTFEEITVPPGADTEVLNLLLDEAEAAALKAAAAEDEKLWQSNS